MAKGKSQGSQSSKKGSAGSRPKSVKRNVRKSPSKVRGQTTGTDSTGAKKHSNTSETKK
tara:strand:- start:597 stop:773 length:177 start_codon:yes stop_codon:yes gene_type:complete